MGELNGTGAELGFDFHKFLQKFIESKKVIAVILLAAVAGVATYGALFGAYNSVGYFQFGMSLPDYKRLQSAMAAPGKWEQFLQMKKNADQAELRNLQFSFGDERLLQSIIVPVYPFTKSELKDLPESANKDVTAGIAAIKVSFKAHTAELAQRGVYLIGDFLRDTAILMNYRDNVITKYSEYSSTQRKYENSVIDTKYQLAQLEIKRAGMQKILRDYPDSAKSDGRQLVSISEGSSRFLSPITQLVALESTIMEQTQNLPKILRDQHINSLYLRYYEKVLGLLDKSDSGETFLKQLPELRESLKLNLDDEVEKMVDNNIALENEGAQAFYFKKIRFVGVPTKPFTHSLGFAQSIFIGLIGGLALSILYVLLIDLRKKQTNPPLVFPRPKSRASGL